MELFFCTALTWPSSILIAVAASVVEDISTKAFSPRLNRTMRMTVPAWLNTCNQGMGVDEMSYAAASTQSSRASAALEGERSRT